MLKSALFNQIQADVYNKKISLPANSEATSLGAWISAAYTLGIYSSYQAALFEAESGTERAYYSPIENNAAVYRKIM